MRIDTYPNQACEKLIDMHSHTWYSDGDYLPQDLIHLAISENIGVLGITDHDTCEGIKRIDRNDEQIKQSGIIVVNGIELSALANKGQIHILGYGIDPNNNHLNEMVNFLRQCSVDSLLAVRQAVEEEYSDIRFNEDDIQIIVNSERNIGRPDLARLLFEYGFAKTQQEAFKQYLITPYKKVRGQRKGLHYNDCIKLLLQCGAIPVLAHPKSLEMDEGEFIYTLDDMVLHGLQGVEAFHSSHSEEEMKYYANIATIKNLFISSGSDFHGTLKPDIQLGTGKNGNLSGKCKKLSILTALADRGKLN